MPDISPIMPGAAAHKAKWVVVSPDQILENGWLLVADGIIQKIGTGSPPSAPQVTDHGETVLMPGLINAHTHLELCALQGRVPFDGGFQPWVRRVLQEREALGVERLIRGAESGVESVTASGTVAVGDVSTLGITRTLLGKSRLSGVWFHEYLGGEIPESVELSEESPDRTLRISAAGHAPHTTSPELLRFLKQKTRSLGLPFSIHLDESEDERIFLSTGKGEWANFLTERGIDFSGWGLPASGPVAYTDQLGILDEYTLAVHLIDAGPAEFEILKRRQTNICLCPRSNKNLHGRLPDLSGMLKAGLSPCLGTDSPASVGSLSLFDEMAFAARCFPEISPSDILKMTTINAAKALQTDGWLGSLAPGKQGAFVRLPVNATTPSQLLEQIIHDTPCF